MVYYDKVLTKRLLCAIILAFDYLGKLRRLGNQMFQYSALRDIASHRGFDYCIPNHNLIHREPFGSDSKIELFSLFMMGSVLSSNISSLEINRPIVREKIISF